MNKKFKKIGIIGAGQMGNGIAHVCALAGHHVYLLDLDKKLLDKATSVIDKNMSRQVSKGLIKETDKKAALKRVKTGTKYEGFKSCGLARPKIGAFLVYGRANTIR